MAANKITFEPSQKVSEDQKASDYTALKVGILTRAPDSYHAAYIGLPVVRMHGHGSGSYLYWPSKEQWTSSIDGFYIRDMKLTEKLIIEGRAS